MSPVRAGFQEQGIGSSVIHSMTLQGQCHRAEPLTVSLWAVGSSVEVTWACLSQSQGARTKPVRILGLGCSPPHPQVTGQTPESPPHFKQDQPQSPPHPFFFKFLQNSEASPEENRVRRRREPRQDTLCVAQVRWGKEKSAVTLS